MKSTLIKLFTLIFASLIGITTLSFTPVFADDVCSSNASTEIKKAAGCSGTSSSGLGLFDVIESILYVVISIAGIIAVIFIIVGGFQYMTSSGDPSKTKKAKDTILYSVIGLIVCALAFAIVNFVINGILKQ
ncbi:hypothetical protein IJH01_01735 [Candidatus Saccharibacteria bacterium]|nr:hypothetical protein [Candidatus Saccharibacteria bacterium]